MMMGGRFKPGDVVFCEEVAWGCGTVVEASNPYIMRVDFGRNGVRSLSITDHWRLATEEDKRRPVGADPEPEPEPSYPEDEVSLENLEAEVSGWERSVRYFEAGFDCDEEYTHDLFFRECLHGILNAFSAQGLAVPDDLLARIEAADKRFIELTFELERDVWGGASNYDRNVYWYYFRMLIK